MRFFGQEFIRKELNYLLPQIKEGENYNIIFRAPSGYGKTTLALMCVYYLGFKNSRYYIPNYAGEIDVLDTNKRIHVIDEVHILKTPEILYPYMDSKQFTFILASNESGTLKEPLINRCIPFIFNRYTEEEMEEIVRDRLAYELPDELIREIVNRVRGVPRVAKVTCERLNYVMKGYLVPKTLEELNEILEEILQIKERGLTNIDEQYLQYLRECGGRAGLNTLISGIGLDRETILTEIEPHLLHLGMIRITSRGRILNDTFSND